MMNILFSIIALITCPIVSAVNIVSVIAGRDDLSTLNSALRSTGLNSTLGGDGPFTIFAPTNDGFDAITIPTDVAELTKILKYHVLNNVTLLEEDISSGLVKETSISQSISFNTDDELTIYDTMGRATNISNGLAELEFDNGVLYVINDVLLPDGTLADITKNVNSLSSLNEELLANDLDDTLMTAGPFTLFAPTNDAVDAFNGTIDSDVLLYHVLSGQYLAADVPTTATELPSANRVMTELTVERTDEGVFVTDQEDRIGQVTMANIISSNGVVHVIDIVLSPGDIIIPTTTMDETSTMEPEGDSVNKLSPFLSVFCFCFVCLFNIF